MPELPGQDDSSAKTRNPEIEDADFPGLYQSADATSLSAQRIFLILQRIHIASLVLGSGVAAFAALVTDAIGPWFYGVIAVILSLGILVLLAERSRRDDQVWFDCRAIAESAKTAAWRFMMGAAPHRGNAAVNESFITELREIRNARPGCAGKLAGRLDPDAQAISPFMNDVRSRTLEERKVFFIHSRLRDQKSWYSRKANVNARSESRWFWLTTGLQALAVALSILEASSGGFRLNVVPILTTCAAAAVAWSQMKRYSELAQTYSLAAQELGELESIAVDIAEEKEFLALVEQVEDTISREHTMWCARRDVILKPRQ